MKIKILCASCGKKLDGANYLNTDGDLVLLVDNCNCNKEPAHENDKRAFAEIIADQTAAMLGR